MNYARLLPVAVLVCVAAPAFAQLQDLDEQLRTTPIRADKLAENFYVLFGVGGNIVLTIGTSGVLLVDDQFTQMAPKYKATIGDLGGFDKALDGVRLEENVAEHRCLIDPVCLGLRRDLGL